MDYVNEKIVIEITANLVKQYAAVSGDTNPIHLLKSVANQAGFPNPVAHGMLTMAIGAKVISPLLQDGWRLSYYKMRFSSPLFVNDVLTIETKLLSSASQEVILKIRGENQHWDTVVSGKIDLIIQN
ncbi:MaoC family dehydratase [Oceanobacillus sp. CFH 90083]|uniref:MaoC family dehydratase n=1 Tax=Oceanobacillus sp. CFH 90083 TaxID=2592336 RepID=UPI0018836D04|nr:MaoC family dehydratase [Oceanobacillus sp. CFH 90083]